jgi:hypothetical protein
MLESGESIPISAVRVGDVILAADDKGRTTFSEVIAAPHSEVQESSYLFTRIVTATGEDIKVTTGHIIPVVVNCDADQTVEQIGGNRRPIKYLEASEVRVGMCVLRTTRSPENQEAWVPSVLDPVAFIEQDVVGRGLYTVIADEPFIVVNGLVTSPFAGSHEAGDTFFWYYRWLYSGHKWLSERQPSTSGCSNETFVASGNISSPTCQQETTVGRSAPTALVLHLLQFVFMGTSWLLRSRLGVQTLHALGQVYAWWAPIVVWSYSTVLSF